MRAISEGSVYEHGDRLYSRKPCILLYRFEAILEEHLLIPPSIACAFHFHETIRSTASNTA